MNERLLSIWIHIKMYKWWYLALLILIIIILVWVIIPIIFGIIMFSVIGILLFWFDKKVVGMGKDISIKNFPYNKLVNRWGDCWKTSVIELLAFTNFDQQKDNTNPLIVKIIDIIKYFKKEKNGDSETLIASLDKELVNYYEKRHMAYSNPRNGGNSINFINIINNLTNKFYIIDTPEEAELTLPDNSYNKEYKIWTSLSITNNINRYKDIIKKASNIIGFIYTIKVLNQQHVITIIKGKYANIDDNKYLSISDFPMISRSFTIIDNLDQISPYTTSINIVLFHK